MDNHAVEKFIAKLEGFVEAEPKTSNQMKPTKDQWSAYQQIFDYFNQELFDGKLPGVILNFSRKAKTHGFFAHKRWEGAGGQKHEISLNPEIMIRDPKEYLSTLVHEMVHEWELEIEEKSPRRNYHTRVWADKMKSIGLIPSNTGEPGGKEVGQSMSHYIEPGGKYEVAYEAMPKDYLLPFTAVEWFIKPSAPKIEGERSREPGKGAGASKKGVNRNQYKSKYTCPSCSINMWGKAGLNVKCADCDEFLMILDDTAK
ncbi:MAG: SprT-like domain-containing protein [Bacteroidota bacterium]